MTDDTWECWCGRRTEVGADHCADCGTPRRVVDDVVRGEAMRRLLEQVRLAVNVPVVAHFRAPARAIERVGKLLDDFGVRSAHEIMENTR